MLAVCIDVSLVLLCSLYAQAWKQLSVSEQVPETFKVRGEESYGQDTSTVKMMLPGKLAGGAALGRPHLAQAAEELAAWYKLHEKV